MQEQLPKGEMKFIIEPTRPPILNRVDPMHDRKAPIGFWSQSSQV